ncbi:hypothetical protein SAMN04487898_11348 [Pedobacter sp. ok626]|uniref:hypothetical protein n=1 Tax=Pedobacter sp. ok626 TaxID=1761882 RepID=UPI00088A1D45|nr:hypothetical protein [Pedobacter sp. ok626]SDK92904.1 hypothetical protein SAMN04487898_11348 [Pedobacter sp. ok626]
MSINFKNIALLDEIETANKLVRLGFGELQNIDYSNNFYFLPFQLLSQGFERLMKTYICLGYFNVHGDYPNLNYIKGLGHDLEALIRRILFEFFDDQGKYHLINDRGFLENDAELKELLYILSEFGKMARYHNFDIITANQKSSINPRDLWEQFEHKILPSGNIEKYGDRDLENEVFGDISRTIIIIFEKFVSALARQFNFGTLGDHAKQFSVHLFDFSMLYPDKLGQTDYRVSTTRFKETPKKVHKRTVLDELVRKLNRNYKSKAIRKNDYKGEWPFYAEKIIIECRNKHWCIITIEGHDYALNGSAKGKYKLESPHEAGMAKLGVSIADFISIALGL